MINTFLIPKSAKIWSSHALPIKKTKGNLDGMSRDRPLGDEFHYHLTLPEYLIDKGGRFACLLFPGGKCLNEKFCAHRKYKLFWFFSLQFFPFVWMPLFCFRHRSGRRGRPRNTGKHEETLSEFSLSTILAVTLQCLRPLHDRTVTKFIILLS